MALYDWKEEYSVGVSEMDKHHRKLFALMNSLHEAMKGGKATEALFSIIKEMSDYTKYHFKEEEQLMAKVNYIGLPAQKEAHQAFIAKLDEFKADAEKPGKAIFVVTKLSSTAGEWLKKHVMIMDKQYAKFMNDAGIS